VDLLDGALARLTQLQPFRAPNTGPSPEDRARNPSLLRDELVAAVRLARQGAWRLARRAGVDVPDDDALAADLAACVALQRAAWLASSRPGGLDDSLRHLPPVG
jgi:hypothetical protein